MLFYTGDPLLKTTLIAEFEKNEWWVGFVAPPRGPC